MNLNDDQKNGLEKILHGGNYFITGIAGAGKSVLLNELRVLPNVVYAAPSASAASLIKGATLHSLFRIPARDIIYPGCLPPLNDKRDRKVIEAIQTVVIDEISMCRSDIFYAINQRLCENPNPELRADRPFGGRQVILCGDFFQLPPVIKGQVDDEPVEKVLTRVYGGIYVFQTALWMQAHFSCINLRQSMRPTEKNFTDNLNAVRVHDEQKLPRALTELNERVTPESEIPDTAIYIGTMKRDVERLNKSCYDQLPGEEQVYNATITGNYPTTYPNEKVLHLKIGEKVIITANLSPDVVNGSRGTVIGFEEKHVRVLLDGKDPQLNFPVPKYRYQNYKYALVHNDETDKDELRAEEDGAFIQHPLIAGYAITAHRAQGMTLSQVALDLHYCFAPGQAYVALSRCRNIDDLYLLNPIKRQAIIVSDDVRAAELKLYYEPERLAHAIHKVIFEQLTEDERFQITAVYSIAFAVLKQIFNEYCDAEGEQFEPMDIEERYYADRFFQYIADSQEYTQKIKKDVLGLYREYLIFVKNRSVKK